jgi:hypothetical protein
LVEHLLCKQGVGGSSPLVSTTAREMAEAAARDERARVNNLTTFEAM